MNARLRSILAVGGVAAVSAAAVLAWQWQRQARSTARLRAELAARLAERAQLASAEFPDLAAARVALEQERAACGRELFGGAGGGAVPAGAVEAWFEISAMGDRLRAAAVRAGVRLSSTEHFGFASHRREGPGPPALAMVLRQRHAVERLVQQLLESRPHALQGVQRERPPGFGGGDAGDFFEMEERLSVGRPGLIDATALRLEFSGPTAVLRTFVAGLAAGDEPLIVRSIEVTPLLADEGGRAAWPEAGGESGPVPIVRPGPARFVVVVEHLAAAPSS